MTYEEAQNVYQEKILESCVHMQLQQNKWLREFGTPEGRERWLADQAQLHKNIKAAKSYWYRLKKRCEKNQRFNYACSKGHESHCVRELIDGPDALTMYEGPPTCDRQEACSDFISVDRVIDRLLARPKASA